MTDLALILIIILIVVLLLRGPRNLPRLGAAAGDAVRNARRAADRSTARTGEDSPGEEPRT